MNHVLIRLTRKHALDVALKRIICIKITIKNNLSELAGVFIRLQEFSKQTILTKKVAFNLHLTLDEILNNIISYGYEDTALHFIDITLQKKMNAFISLLRMIRKNTI